jgi:tetratricopeptide (TPR) repeat protein
MIPALLLAVVVTGCTKGESSQTATISVEQRSAAIEAAMVYLDNGKFIEALAIMKSLIAKVPQSAEAQESYALVLLAYAGDLEKDAQLQQAAIARNQALAAYESACANTSKPELLLLSTAQLAHMLGEESIAKQYYERAHEESPEDSRASFFLAQMNMLNKQWEGAKIWIEQSLSRDATEPFALLSSALIEAELGNLEEAMNRATKGCSIRPNDFNLRLLQARVLRIAKRPRHALEILAALPEPLRSSNIANEERKLCALLLEENTQ